MAKEIIAVGATANDGTGDTLRGAFTKTNSNFTEVYNATLFAGIMLQADYALTSTVSLQKLFNVGSASGGVITLETGFYQFEAILNITGMSATSGNAQIDISGGGSAILADILWSVRGVDTTNIVNAAAQSGSFHTTAASGAAIISAGAGTIMAVVLRGTFDCTTAGTMIPSIALLTASAATTKAGSHFFLRKVAPTGATYFGPVA